MHAPSHHIAARLTAWENYLNGKDDGPATVADRGDHWDLDVISRDASLTGDSALIEKAKYVQELFVVAVLRDNNQMHDVLMQDDAPDTYTRLDGVQGVTLAELDEVLAGV